MKASCINPQKNITAYIAHSKNYLISLTRLILGMSKVILLTVCYSYICVVCVCAQNLVPNGSFEDYNKCPNADDQVNKTIGWTSYGQSPDYFNSCDQLNLYGVPLNELGYQKAAKGKAYCGIFTFGSVVQNYREFIGAKLLNPLIVGNKYYLSLKVCLAENSDCASDKLGISFSGIPNSFSSPTPIKNNASIYSHSIITDTLNWTIISGAFIADSTYKYIIIGNFFQDNQTNTNRLLGNYCNAYYFIDDICVSTDSFACELSIFTNNKSENDFKIFPNPASEQIYLEINDEFDYSLNNIIGQKIIYNHSNGQSNINISQIPSGIYFLEINCRNKKIVKKQLIVH